jgi:uncharacterized membrane protein YkvA (DUF1232 family)
MATRTTSWLLRPSLFRTLFTHARLAFRLLREPRVATLMKVVPLLAVAYVLSPLDFIPDVIPFVGEVDDLGIVLLAIEGFLRLCPDDALTFHRKAIEEGRRYSPMGDGDRVIDAEWRHAR